MKILIIIITLYFTSKPILAQDIQQNCKEFIDNATFKYKDKKYDGIITIKGNKHSECFNNGCITSKIKWLSDCSYEMEIIKNTIKNSSLQKKTKATIKILIIEGNEMEYEILFKGKKQVFTLVKNT